MAGIGAGMPLVMPPTPMFRFTSSGTPAAMTNAMMGSSASNLLLGSFPGTSLGRPFVNPYAGLAAGLGYGAAGRGGSNTSQYGAPSGSSGYGGGGYGSAGSVNPSSGSAYGSYGLSPYANLSSGSGYGTASSGTPGDRSSADRHPPQETDAGNRPGRPERQQGAEPSAAEIQSAQALNAGLAELQRLLARDSRGPFFPLDQQVLRQIHVVPGPRATRLLRDRSQLAWPPALKLPAPERDRLSRLFEQAITRVKQGTGRPADLYELSDAVADLHARLAADAGTLSLPELAQARRFLNDLDDTLKVLGQPDASQFLQGQYAARGETVEELILNMTDLGLRFAPAAGGEEAAYAALYRDLADYRALCRSP